MASNEAVSLSPGIIYLSRIPPYMKPNKVKHIFSQYGEIGRVYLQPEDPAVRKRRVKFGGNRKQNYTEGWVEFKDKRIAKRVALMLNNTNVGGKKRNYHHDDLWNLKYLSKFNWTHITEKIAYDSAVRKQKLHTEVSQARKEIDHYLQAVDKKKVKTAILERKRKAGTLDEEEEGSKITRKVKQRKLNESEETGTTNCLSDKILSKILR
ncbi:PREDICTED: pre-rRNA-processing protein esf2-like [Amphimedon queenslandica]|uniref:Activator of basal transcription 1 n=1 Tax=Amphimedon queenslandica TaxID=400682 RepID=A0A1X7VQD6_AMPQE|nr:PREDICTED: pre-rRNA-processing protein esf2-like [Amphimedon queenslandica]|eukprot:XP_003383402.1 PREDICTED: pre-rRNA-processing protein esf2-like [Amphimedon queenslandica]